MCFFFFGVEDFSTKVQGYENLFVYCPICHNISVTPINEKKFITICFIPLIPYSWGKVMRCYICSWFQNTDDAEIQRISIMKYQTPSPHNYA
ncbi:uncharacterized protein T551_00779 [Pneumocystis jirovecii RU7]|uniref:Zinc-ribbon 15 domain-containing protein n=1 Tax=Pneumocystis jirovecii (strain RU7) TaxID=1408657 RepID=A0A0W4ZUP1_PNEJ7|nr:uncharacterized protein T551_00779 [Pneumocystis jirovecii RU7]KTW32097.1 hypothetical protein T551_00779 [Pneumocystis jirovecii RU7]